MVTVGKSLYTGYVGAEPRTTSDHRLSEKPLGQQQTSQRLYAPTRDSLPRNPSLGTVSGVAYMGFDYYGVTPKVGSLTIGMNSASEWHAYQVRGSRGFPYSV